MGSTTSVPPTCYCHMVTVPPCGVCRTRPDRIVRGETPANLSKRVDEVEADVRKLQDAVRQMLIETNVPGAKYGQPLYTGAYQLALVERIEHTVGRMDREGVPAALHLFAIATCIAVIVGSVIALWYATARF